MKTLIKLIVLIAIFSGIQTTEAAEVSFYRDLGTVHASKYNDELNNNNDVTIVKINGFLAGSMINSYGNQGYFLGYQPEVYSYGKVSVDFGATVITGYEKWQTQLSVCSSNWNDSCYDQIVIVAPILSISYNLNDHIAVQANNMGVVFNAGLRINF
jgi:hypothetical protein